MPATLTFRLFKAPKLKAIDPVMSSTSSNMGILASNCPQRLISVNSIGYYCLINGPVAWTTY